MIENSQSLKPKLAENSKSLENRVIKLEDMFNNN